MSDEMKLEWRPQWDLYKDDAPCEHATIQEIIHMGTPFTYEYQCHDCKAMLVVDPDEYAEYQAGERDDFAEPAVVSLLEKDSQ